MGLGLGSLHRLLNPPGKGNMIGAVAASKWLVLRECIWVVNWVFIGMEVRLRTALAITRGSFNRMWEEVLAK